MTTSAADPAPVVLHCDPDHAADLIERLRTARETIHERFRYGVRTNTVLLLCHRSESATSWSLGIDVVENDHVRHQAVVSCLYDWPLAGIQRMEQGRLPASAAFAAIDAVIDAVSASVPPDADANTAIVRHAETEAPMWIDEYRSVNPEMLGECLNDDGRWSVLVDRDSTIGTPFVSILGDDTGDDLRIDTMIPDERIARLIRRHPAHVVANDVDGLAVINASDVDGPIVEVDDDPLQTLRRMARDQE